MDKKMSLSELAEVMIEHGLVIRAIPHESAGVYEAYHKNKYPDGVVEYLPEYKREMLRVTTKNSQGGKFIITKKEDQGATVHGWEWGKNIVFYDTIEEAVESIVEQPKSK